MKARVLKIKAWDSREKLMVRLSAVDCKKGVLLRAGYEIFMFTGTFDQNETEIYDGDVLLYANKRYVVKWNEEKIRWEKRNIKSKADSSVLTPLLAQKTLRLCHLYESEYKIEN